MPSLFEPAIGKSDPTTAALNNDSDSQVLPPAVIGNRPWRTPTTSPVVQENVFPDMDCQFARLRPRLASQRLAGVQVLSVDLQKIIFSVNESHQSPEISRFLEALTEPLDPQPTSTKVDILGDAIRLPTLRRQDKVD